MAQCHAMGKTCAAGLCGSGASGDPDCKDGKCSVGDCLQSEQDGEGEEPCGSIKGCRDFCKELILDTDYCDGFEKGDCETSVGYCIKTMCG